MGLLPRVRVNPGVCFSKETDGPYNGVLPVMRAFSSEPLRMSNRPVVLTLVVTGARNLNRELFKGRRSLEPVGSRTINYRGTRGVAGWMKFIENQDEFMSRRSL